ncbi:MAG TPA: sigma 54-interacting transcriptional regulator [Candidatus Hydrogenedentes bacterium]|nr:sigma 54-interacting transcriptional regulator [Candidatus Hydrogenedentota bacterium]HOS02086.1 sigma 54-interacting transcriptional regulator [Candidatus Hydrogenedentota bacterium]
MRPTKLSAKVFYELPGMLARYLEGGKNLWMESLPREGKLTLLNRPGAFSDLESLAVERRQLLDILGHDRARALLYRIGFEQGRRDASRHYAIFSQNARLALQAGPVFKQLQGRFVAEPPRFEFDLDAKTLYREGVLLGNVEAQVHRMIQDAPGECVCWGTAGYLSGHITEVLGKPVLTLETECVSDGAPACRFISKLSAEWGGEAEWARQAFRLEPVDREIARAAEGVPVEVSVKDSATPSGGEEDDVPVAPPEIGIDGFWARDASMRPVVLRARQLAVSDVPVCIVGESGTGRETLAKAMHAMGPRSENPFVVLDCIGMDADMLARELWGHAPGAFPGAVRASMGAATRAHGGALYVNEVTRLPLDVQGGLLRALEDRRLYALGEDQPREADFRLIAATQSELKEALDEGLLREELYYALTAGRIAMPALRNRGSDAGTLAASFLKEARLRHGRPDMLFSEETREVLLDCAWPGNVRQLRNAIEYAVLVAQGPEITPADLPEEVLVTRMSRGPQELNRDVVLAALRQSRGNRSEAAERLGVGRTTLWRAMRRWGIE